jgi:2-iminobutanoate/2-iminopropanoate deaminase
MKQHFNLPGKPSGLPFSDAVQVGNTLYIAGRIGVIPGTRTVPKDPREEARNMLDAVQAVLQQAGLTMDDLVYVQIFTPDVSLFDTFNSIYVEYFKQALPARAFIGSGPLLFGARFEMIAMAERS